LKKLSGFFQTLKSITAKKRKLIPILIGVLVLPVTLLLISQAQDLRNRASDETLPLNDENISEASVVEKTAKSIRFTMSSSEKPLMTLPSPDENGVIEVLKKSPKLLKRLKTQPVKTKTIDESGPVKLLPNNFHKMSYLKVRDEEPRNQKGNQLTHYRYGQKINDIPVLNAELIMHVRNKTDLYAMFGSLVNDESIPTAVLSEKDAQTKALSKAMAEDPLNRDAKITTSEKVIFNGKMMGVSGDDNNHIAQKISIVGPEKSNFAKFYIIDLTNGDLLYEESLIYSINREVYDYNAGMFSPPGTESNPPKSGDMLNSFTNFGTTYNFFLSTFGRNSYNNEDDLLKSFVNSPSFAKNAAWFFDAKVFQFGSGMVTPDIVAHEYTHAITQHTAALSYSYQSGAIHESISDIFGSSADNNWTLGESSVAGIIRDMSNPPLRSQPDRLFSELYSCDSRDNGGVHTNSGIANKAYYLMTTGGSFNGCSITGIGRQDANRIIYRALTYYLSPSSNYYSLYAAILSSCADLFGSTSHTCLEVKKAVEAVEIDQQPISDQSGALCLGIAEQLPKCASSEYVTPTIANPTPTPTTTPTPTPTPYAVNLIQNGNAWTCDGSGWMSLHANNATTQFTAERYTDKSTDDNCYFKVKCSNSTCEAGQSVYQDIVLSSKADIEFGGKFSSPQPSSGYLYLFQLSSSGRIIKSDYIALSTNGTFQKVSKKVVIDPETKTIRYQVYPQAEMYLDELYATQGNGAKNPTPTFTPTPSPTSTPTPARTVNLLKNSILDTNSVNYWAVINGPKNNTLIGASQEVGAPTYYLWANCSAFPCEAGQSVYQDVLLSSQAGFPTTLKYGGDFAIDTGSGYALLYIFQLDSKGAILENNHVLLNLNARYASTLKTFTRNSSATIIRYTLYLLSDGKLKAQNMFLGY